VHLKENIVFSCNGDLPKGKPVFAKMRNNQPGSHTITNMLVCQIMSFLCYTQSMKLMGIDYGTKRVGIAISDDEGRIAFPHDVLPCTKNLAEVLKTLCQEKGVARIVIGESRDFNQKENPIMPAVHALKKTLEEKTGLPVYLEPEMLTTQEAKRLHHKVSPRDLRGNREKLIDTDASAAALILQSYIDRTRNQELPSQVSV